MMNLPDPSTSALYLLGFADLRAPTTTNAADSHIRALGSHDLGALAHAHMIHGDLLKQLRIESLRVGDVLAWYKLIERSEFEGEASAGNLADLNWLTPRVLAHEAIVSKLCDYFVLYPARFGCLFSTSQRLVNFVTRHSVVLHEYFRRVAQRREWGIKLVANVDAACEHLARQSLAETDGVGRNYLKFKQLTRQLRPTALEQLDLQGQRLLSELERKFPQVVVRTLSLKNSSDRQRVLANVALLLDAQETEQLHTWCQQPHAQQELGLDIELQLTGPWPAYSFCPSLTDEDQLPIPHAA